ncbi:MAG: nitrate reductase subunit beta [Burkholderiales bacterium]|nr:nitrate reductase subunit beta [Burkholderiales bacterium]
MKIKAQIGMVLNLDKCIGCHTCSVTCKNVWTNRPGMEYVWFNNVETKPGIGYPKQWEDQAKWKGGWQARQGHIKLKRGTRFTLLCAIFYNGKMPGFAEYYEPYTFDYQNLQKAPRMTTSVTAQPVSYMTGKKMKKIVSSAAWDDNLGGTNVLTVKDVDLKSVEREIYAQYANTFMFYLPRICEHCLNPACVASCPQGSIYKREEDGIVLVDQDKCKGWRMCISGCPYKKIYYNWSSGKAEKCIFCYPRVESGMPTVCAETCVGRIRYMGVMFYDADKIKELAATEKEEDLYEAQRLIFMDPNDPKVQQLATEAGISQDWIEAAQKSPIYKMIMKWKIALPLHPEYRTLPMVWYVPPLSPIAQAADLKKIAMNGDIPDFENLRIPVQYLANLLTGGNLKVVQDVLRRLLVERKILRRFSTPRGISQFLKCQILPDELQVEPEDKLEELGLTVEDICEMHNLLAIADYKDRFVVPSANRNAQASMLMQGTQGANFGGGKDMRRRADAIFGGPMSRKIIPLFEDYKRMPDKHGGNPK